MHHVVVGTLPNCLNLSSLRHPFSQTHPHSPLLFFLLQSSIIRPVLLPVRTTLSQVFPSFLLHHHQRSNPSTFYPLPSFFHAYSLPRFNTTHASYLPLRPLLPSPPSLLPPVSHTTPQSSLHEFGSGSGIDNLHFYLANNISFLFLFSIIVFKDMFFRMIGIFLNFIT